jgi:hypothetical protein
MLSTVTTGEMGSKRLTRAAVDRSEGIAPSRRDGPGGDGTSRASPSAGRSRGPATGLSTRPGEGRPWQTKPEPVAGGKIGGPCW